MLMLWHFVLSFFVRVVYTKLQERRPLWVADRARPTLSQVLELLNLSNAVPELNKIRRSPDLEALKLREGRSGEDGCCCSSCPVGVKGKDCFRKLEASTILQLCSLLQLMTM